MIQISRRTVPTTPGLTYADANGNRLVTYGPDTLDVKRQIEELWGGTLECYFDLEQEEWIVVENCRDGVQRLAVPPLKPAQFNPKLIDRLREASQTDAEEAMNAIDAYNAQVEREEDYILEQISGDAGERLIHAFKKDGLHDHLDIYGPRPKRIPHAIRPHQERQVA